MFNVQFFLFLGRALDVAQAGDSIATTKTKVRTFRENVDRYHSIWYKKAVEVAEGLGVQPVAPRVTSRQRNRTNVVASDPEEYYRRALTIPLLGRFTSIYVIDVVCF